MFSSSFQPTQLIQTFLPGLQSTNHLVIGARNGARHASRTSGLLCENSLRETLRKLECLSPAELGVLSSKCAQIIPTILPKPQNVNFLQNPTSADCFGSAKSLMKAERRIQTYLQKLESLDNRYLLPKSKLFKHNPTSPFLQSARGFKTRRSSDESGSPFTRAKKTSTSENSDPDSKSQAELLAQILKHIDLPKQEREKVNIAVVSYAAGFANAKDQSSGTNPTVLGKTESTKRKFLEWTKIHNLASILVIVAILISLGQIFNIPFLRVSRGSNEISPEDIEVTFEDVKGCDEAKQELQEIVEFLMNPDKFSALGGRLPKGCLLVGPPGTGKTLLARAVAGQAGVPFFHASGSEFDEVLVGQGARRVRDLFKAAKARAPCVIFIDEIDSVGSKRSSSVLHPYANQTINQLLSEMDGFMSNEGVIVLGATNRAEDLDNALLRPGRFDTQVTVTNPDIAGRREILTLYLAKIKHDDSVDVEKLAKMSVGFSGADLQNMVNTAAIRAAVECKDWVSMIDFEYSHDKHVLGTDWKSRVRDKEDLKITAYHEAGHTLVAYFTANALPIHKVTIVAKGQSGGHTAFLPDTDQWHVTKAQLLARMDVGMGGRAAEEIIFGKEKITGGASHDLEGCTSTAEMMVQKLGLSDKLGLRVVRTSDLSPATNEIVDTEVTKMLNDSYIRACTILRKHRKELDMLAENLLNYETLDSDDIQAIMEQRPPAGRISQGSQSLKYKVIKPGVVVSQEPKGTNAKHQEPKGSPPIGSGSDVLPS